AAPDSGGPANTALADASRVLETDPSLAADILRTDPHQPLAMLLLGVAHRRCGEITAALQVLRRLCTEQPDMSAAWLELAELLSGSGLADEADTAYARYLKSAGRDPELRTAAAALNANDVPRAEALLRARVRRCPTDVAALRMLAEVCARLTHHREACTLLERCLELWPGFDAARYNYATVLNREGRAAQAQEQCRRLRAKAPDDPGYLTLEAAISANLGNYADALLAYESVLARYPRQPRLWMSYGHALKTLAKIPQSIAAYRQALQMQPTLGEAYWSLANLKTFRFSDAEVLAMREALERTDLTDEDRLHFEFALGKALEDAQSFEQSFAHYAAGNALRRKAHGYDPQANSNFVRRSKQLFTPEFFAERAGAGALADDPIFIVGLPRAGSTLIEQILASHSRIEGTMELPDLPRIARELAGPREDEEEGAFLTRVAGLERDQLRALGERYLAETRIMRKTAAPRFIDKMPNNFWYIGLIHLMLPNALIIDVRRHPLACCFSCFKQHFARGQWFTYGLEDLGLYYRDYVELMAHYDEVLPGKVVRVCYEELIGDPERNIRELLERCGLPFEPQCLSFHENSRAVRTASAEQVRRPIFRDGIDQWRHYELWLGPLKSALGEVLNTYPHVPEFR
ncbi:MAG: tetratricopeptide repeat-containing sulfotransferase family protein, partial [Steroidobacteraceae bacterium]